jgi:hypothetical protein
VQRRRPARGGVLSVQLTIDTTSKRDAEIIAAALPGPAEARSWRGYGVIRLRFRNDREARELLPVVEACVQGNELAWARVRIGDDERMFRGRRHRSVVTDGHRD